MLHAILTATSDGTLTIGLDFEPSGRPGRFLNWKKQEDGYSYLAHGVRQHSDWVQLIEPPFPESAWLHLHGSTFGGIVEGIGDNILGLQNVVATDADGVTVAVKSQAYLILRTSRNVIEFREEIDADMPCDGPVPPPPVMPPILRASPPDFFDGKGGARFSIVYTKGC